MDIVALRRARNRRSRDEMIRRRTLKGATLIVNHRMTVRAAARELGVGKSTVHKDMTERLPEIDINLHGDVMEVLSYNKSVRHIRGGEATSQKYLKINSEKN